MTIPLTPEEQAAEAAYFAELHREAYDAVAGADLRPAADDDRSDGYRSPYYYETGQS